jgi:hypothetical protein
METHTHCLAGTKSCRNDKINCPEKEQVSKRWTVPLALSPSDQATDLPETQLPTRSAGHNEHLPHHSDTVPLPTNIAGYPGGSFTLGTSNPTFLHLKKPLLHSSKLLHTAWLAGAAGKMGAGEGKGWVLGVHAVIAHSQPTL